MGFRNVFRPRKFHSNEEYFEAVRNAIAELQRNGYPAAAAQVDEGFGALNGLTDGWGILFDALEKTLAELPADVSPETRQRLVDVRDGAYDAIYRR